MNKLKLLALLLLLPFTIFAQTGEQKEDVITRPFQLSFVTPLGTNGMESGQTINKVSINLFAGYAYGLDGAEFAGFANIIRNDVRGLQMAGFTNVVGGSVKGVQMAGFSNITCGPINAAQFAGFANINSDSSSGAQFAGFTNISGKHHGLQMAGFMNIAKETDGTQVAGFLNITKRLKGLQLGFLNVVDSVEEGTPIGFLSFVGHGYNHVDIWAGETLQLNAAVKLGTKKFYNIIAIGAGLEPLSQKNILGIAYGFGHAFPLAKGSISLDILSYHIMDTDQPFQNKDNEFNQLNQLKLSYDYPFNHLSVFAGPTFNVLVLNSKQTDKDSWQSYAPYTQYESTSGDTRVQMWIGAQVGIRL